MKVSHSALSKAKVILICVLIIGSAVEISAYYYVQNFAPNLFPASEIVSPFQVANLTINPYETSVGQPVVISADVANVGNAQGTYSYILKINDSEAETKELLLAANESQTVTFSITETIAGSYNVTVGDLSDTFSIAKTPIPLPASLKFAHFTLGPTEAWPNQQVNMSVDVTNTGNEDLSFTLPFNVNGATALRVDVQLPSKSSQTITTSITENSEGTYKITAGGQSGTLNIVPSGKHTLHYIASRTGFAFTLDGVPEVSPFAGLVDVGIHTIVIASTAQINAAGWGLTTFVFSSWNDGSTSLTRTVDVEGVTYVVSNYFREGSCPSLYVWNGKSYVYSAEVSDGAGWLGYLDHFQKDGSMVFSYNYPWDYIKLDSTQLQPLNGYYNMKIGEMTDEIFYLDQVKMVAVDHPIGTDVFSTTSTFIYNLADQGTMYTVSSNPAAPLSAVDEKGNNILPLISKQDQNYTVGARWTWNNITLNLGDLSGTKQIKLVVAATINWPTTSAGGINFLKYASQPGVTPSPPPFMEVRAQNGSWVRVPNDRQFPIPDVTDNVFIVNLTGLFQSNNYELRINTYQDIRFDYIGVDTTSQQNIIVHTIMPSSADFEQAFTTDSNSSGAFTRYGNVNSLLQAADNEFVIGRQGDTVSLQFPADLPPVPKGMVRDYFVIASCWFKGKGLSYVPFTVDPLPFQAMTSFPYPSTESYPYDSVHQAYLQVYNSRIVKSS